MSDNRPYIRVYYNDLIRDYPEVWEDDDALATWLRLLATADPMWPTPPELPRSVRTRPLERLVKASLVALVLPHRFRMKGMDAERGRRSDAARNAAAGRWHDKGNADRNATGNAETMPKPKPSRSRAESEAEHTARDGLPNIDAAAVRALEHRTGRPVQIAGDKQLTEYDRLIEDHGLEKVLSAMDRLMTNGQPMTARQLVWGAMKVLEPMLDPRDAAKAERQEEVEQNSRREVERTQKYLRDLRSVGSREAS